jgi:hypothetical protein
MKVISQQRARTDEKQSIRFDGLRWLFRGITLAVAVLVPALRSDAAEVSWDAPFVVDETTDVSAAGSVHFAADFNTAAGFGLGDGVINGIPFTAVGAAGIPGRLTHSFDQGPNNGAAAYAAVAPAGMDMDLVELLDSHSWMGGNPATATVTIEGLTAGTPYQIQVLGAVDTRTCCSARIYEPDDGQGNFDTGVSYARGEIASIIGSFTADAATQTFQWRSFGEAMGNNDPGMSGLVVLAIPEPGSMVLIVFAAGLCGVVSGWRRQKK